MNTSTTPASANAPSYLVNHINPIRTYGDNGENYETHDLVFENFTLRISGDGKIRPYLTCWILEGWPGFSEAKKMWQNGEWRKVIAEALGTSVGNIWLGFGAGEFDVREF